MIVELKYAGVPFLGIIAVHYWFVTDDAGNRDRWEVWQHKNVLGRGIGHLHRNLMDPDAPVGGGPTRLEHTWTGALADQLAKVLQASWNRYPYRAYYHYWPGPNSNTYVAWVLREAGIHYHLPLRALGKSYPLFKLK